MKSGYTTITPNVEDRAVNPIVPKHLGKAESAGSSLLGALSTTINAFGPNFQVKTADIRSVRTK